MMDLRRDLGDVLRASTRLGGGGAGRVIQFLAARSGEGTSSIAASFAVMAADRARRSVWLMDLDLRRNAAYRAFERGDCFSRLGRPGRPFDASLNQPPFYQVLPQMVGPDGQATQSKLLTLHRLGQSRLMVTRFRNEKLLPGQRVQLGNQPAYWRAARAATDWCVIDAPALDRSAAGLSICSQVDGVVLVLSADATDATDALILRQEIEAHGGRCIGFVLNGVRGDARLADRFSL
jgi:Mrp family chromosome partitioning ATPase